MRGVCWKRGCEQPSSNCVVQSANFYCSFRVLSSKSMPNVFNNIVLQSFLVILPSHFFFFSPLWWCPIFAFDKCTHMFRLKVVMPKTKINNQETTAKNINYRGEKATITCCQFWRYMNRIFSEQTLKNVHVPNSKMLNNVLFALKIGNLENVPFSTRLKWRNGHPLKRRQFRHFPWAKKSLPIQKSL